MAKPSIVYPKAKHESAAKVENNTPPIVGVPVL
jgi:hypothetical protein